MTESIRSMLPKPYQDLFSKLAFGAGSHPVAGLYLSSYVGSEQLLALLPSSEYHLLYWDSRDASRQARHYTGRCSLEDGSVQLDIELTDGSLGSDANCETLVPMRSGGVRYLLADLHDIATSIHWSDHLGETRNYFVEVDLDDAIPGYQERGMRAPPWGDLPEALRAITLREPLRATVQKVVSSSDTDGDGSEFLVEINLGSRDGVTKNMPMCSPAGESVGFRAWAWEIEASTSRLGLSAPTDDNDRILRVPQIGDVLVSRQPTLPLPPVQPAAMPLEQPPSRATKSEAVSSKNPLLVLLVAKLVSFVGASLNTVGFLTFFMWPSLVPYRWQMILGGLALIAFGELAGRALAKRAMR